MLAWTMKKIYEAVKDKLHPVSMASEQDIHSSMENLASSCGKKTVIQLCDKLLMLINCTSCQIPGLYESLTSLVKMLYDMKPFTLGKGLNQRPYEGAVKGVIECMR
ncbi:uncharacterized protein VP01_7080g1, partial [Puccinia sorghi]